MEALVADMRREMKPLQERTQSQSQADDKVRILHQALMSGMGDFGRGIEEVSASIVATEKKLWQRIEDTRREIEATETKRSNELLEAMEQNGRWLAQSMADDCVKRTLEVNVLKARVDAMHGQYEDLHVTAGVQGDAD